MALTAAPSELPGLRLKDSVTAGNWPSMDDGQRRGPGSQVGERAQRHHLAGGGFDVDLVQRLRRELEMRLGFEDDAVLVELREHDRHLPLPERVVERVVNGLRQDVQRGRPCPGPRRC